MLGDNLTQKTQKKDPYISLHKIKANLPHWAEFETLRNGEYNDTYKYQTHHFWVNALNRKVTETQRFVKMNSFVRQDNDFKATILSIKIKQYLCGVHATLFITIRKRI